MSETQPQPDQNAHLSPADPEMASALFAQLILQQSNMAMMLLGKVAHPESGKMVKDIDAAKLFIDQLEMLEGKTKGNLTKEEASLLKQSLMALRMAFVEAVDSASSPAEERSSGPQPQKAVATEAEGPGTTPPPEEEHRKKFTKKY